METKEKATYAKQIEKDKRLFAATPELLVACKEAKAYIAKAAGATGIGAILDAAIAKAEGR